MLTAAGAAAWATYLHWLPCEGAFFSSSLVHGYQPGPGPGFSDACLRRMDAGGLPFPYPTNPSERSVGSAGPAVIAMVMTGLAWLVVVLGMTWSLRTKAVAVLPAVATFALAVVSAIAAADPSGQSLGNVAGWLGVASEAAAVLALIAIWHWQPEVQDRGFVRVVVVAWATTAFGAVHLVLDYIGMTYFSAANWDVPPLTGSVTVVTLALAAGLTLELTLRSSRSPGATKAAIDSTLLRPAIADETDRVSS